MRVALLTHHWVRNFGANLQALATFRTLCRLGHEVEVLNWRPADLEALYEGKVPPVQCQAHDAFCQRHLVQSRLCRSEEELIEVFNERAYDVILLGSDAVFHLSARDLTEDLRFPNPFWLLWVDERLAGSPFRAVLAASSMGTQFFRLPKPTRAGVRRAWQRMEFLSVRDQWTRWSVAFLTRGRLWPRLCPDPTSVLNDVLDRAAEDDAEAASLDGRYILLSLPAVALREDWLDALVREAHALGYLVFGLALPEGDCPQGVDRVIGHPLDPLAWYAWIRHAAGVIATRFHPAVCSIFNGVPLVSLDYGVWFPKGLVEIRIPSKTYDVCRRAGLVAPV